MPFLLRYSRARRSIAFLVLLALASLILTTHLLIGGGFTFQKALDIVSSSRVALFLTSGIHYDHAPLPNRGTQGILPASTFNFSATPPGWLESSTSTTTSHPVRPIVIRMAIISQPGEFQLRKAFRQYVLDNLPSSLVTVHYRFIIGKNGSFQDRLVQEEQNIHGDVHVLDLKEGKPRLGMKRWLMLKWAAEAPSTSYDYYFSADSDAFVRLGALVRRLRHLRPELSRPREESILWGRMAAHKVHFAPLDPTQDEGSLYWADDAEDKQLPDDATDPRIFWYSYPIGFGFLMSSHLVHRLTRPEILLPHHVRYPGDDVLIGNWVADWAPGTTIVDDPEGFHDPLGHNYFVDATSLVDYNTVVVHHVNVDEMRGLRYMKEFSSEWTGVS